jgi:hypothetical protein
MRTGSLPNSAKDSSVEGTCISFNSAQPPRMIKIWIGEKVLEENRNIVKEATSSFLIGCKQKFPTKCPWQAAKRGFRYST